MNAIKVKLKLKEKAETEEEAALKQKYEQLRRKKEEKERQRLLKEGGDAGGAGADDAAGGAGGAPLAAPDAGGAGGAASGAAAQRADASAAAAHAAASRAPLFATPAPAPRPSADDAVRPRVLASKEEVAALLARSRGISAAAAATPSRADDAPTPAPSLKRPGEGITPRSGLSTDKRPAMKRPAMRTPATGDGKRLKTGEEGDKMSRLWDKVLKPGTQGAPLPGAAGAAQLRPLPAADAHLRRVFVSELPPSVDQMELRNSMARYGGVEDVRLDAHSSTAYVTFTDMEKAKKLVELSEAFTEGYGPPVLVAETPVHVQWSTPVAPGGVPMLSPAALPLPHLGGADGAMLPPAVGALSKQEQLDYAVRTAVATYAAVPTAPPVEAPRPPDRQLVTYEDI